MPNEIRAATAVSYNRRTSEKKEWTIRYIVKSNPPHGSMKKTYFSEDGKWVVQFFLEPENVERQNVRTRLKKILGRYNPTLPEEEGGAPGQTAKAAEYFQDKFCWPVATLEDTQFGFGIVCPKYPPRFSFGPDATPKPNLSRIRRGQDKEVSWFITKNNRNNLRETELGDFRTMLQACVLLARSVRRLHVAGLAHSDLSSRNILIDPPSGKCVIIDIDSLVVPDVFPPQVVGTPGYIAPEVLITQDLPMDDSRKSSPGIRADLHSLAVLIYQMLFFRHPLKDGAETYSFSDDSAQDDFLLLGEKALFIEDPHDKSNRPRRLTVSIHDLGPDLEKLFVRALSDGLHTPAKRPSASRWETALSKATDLLYPCENPRCSMHWFILHNLENPVCPFCKTKITKTITRLTQRAPLRGWPGVWGAWNERDVVNLYMGQKLFRWHFYPNCSRGENVEQSEVAVVKLERGTQLVLHNYALPDLILLDTGDPVPPGQKVELCKGTRLCTSSNDSAQGLLLEVTSTTP